MGPDQGASSATPLTAEEFAARMRRVGPFEPGPHIAVGCSGGGDSMALTLLLHQWTTDCRGRVTALIVDHGIRSESAREARTVADWLSRRQIDARILSRPGVALRGNLQAAARDLRYELMSIFCSGAGIPYLALAHNLEDQAETLLLRLSRGSGVDGLASMAFVTERPEMRLLRPVLDVPRERLRATLRAAGQPFVEDPSNESEAFRRIRIRRIAPALAAEGLTASRLAETASRMGQARDALETAAANVLARAVRLYPEGYGELDTVPLQDAPEEVALRGLSRVLACVAGIRNPPRIDRVRRLHHDLIRASEPFSGSTLAGCRIMPWRRKLLVCRELRAVRDEFPAEGEVIWDGRFRFRFAASTGLRLRRLGRDGWRMVAEDRPDLRNCRIPPPVRPSLPALWDLDAVAFVPHLNYARTGDHSVGEMLAAMSFAPARTLTVGRFAAHKD